LGILQFRPEEDRTGQHSDDSHDRPPKNWRIGDALLFPHRLLDRCRDLFGLSPQRAAAIETRRHWRVDKAWLHRKDVQIAAKETMCQPFRESGNTSLGRPINVVRTAT